MTSESKVFGNHFEVNVESFEISAARLKRGCVITDLISSGKRVFLREITED